MRILRERIEQRLAHSTNSRMMGSSLSLWVGYVFLGRNIPDYGWKVEALPI